jgi:hypothetical protein
MFQLKDSVVKITKIKVVSDKLTVGTVYTTHKNGNDFIKTFIECKIVGEALNKFNWMGIKNKDKFVIQEGTIRNETYKKDGTVRNKLVITIFALDEYTEE